MYDFADIVFNFIKALSIHVPPCPVDEGLVTPRKHGIFDETKSKNTCQIIFEVEHKYFYFKMIGDIGISGPPDQ